MAAAWLWRSTVACRCSLAVRARTRRCGYRSTHERAPRASLSGHRAPKATEMSREVQRHRRTSAWHGSALPALTTVRSRAEDWRACSAQRVRQYIGILEIEPAHGLQSPGEPPACVASDDVLERAPYRGAVP